MGVLVDADSKSRSMRACGARALILASDRAIHPVTIDIEFYGVPRLRAGRAVPSEGARRRRSRMPLRELGRVCPSLEHSVLRAQVEVHPAYRLSLNGDRFISDPETPLVSKATSCFCSSADAGG